MIGRALVDRMRAALGLVRKPPKADEAEILKAINATQPLPTIAQRLRNKRKKGTAYSRQRAHRRSGQMTLRAGRRCRACGTGGHNRRLFHG